MSGLEPLTPSLRAAPGPVERVQPGPFPSTIDLQIGTMLLNAGEPETPHRTGQCAPRVPRGATETTCVRLTGHQLIHDADD